MKIKDIDSKNELNVETDEKGQQKDKFSIEEMQEMTADESDVINKLQATVYNSGIKTLAQISSENIITAETENVYNDALNTVAQARKFSFNIGFAGEQSSGKSMVINSLLEYPLMPTCNLTTTCTVVKLIYGEKIRVIATDDDTQKRVFDLDCSRITQVQFDKLKEYAIIAMKTLVVENLQYFTDKNVKDKAREMTVDDIKDMTASDPKQAALLLLILLSVYVGQNDLEMTEEKKILMNNRSACMKYFGIDADVVNLTVTVQWNSELLKNGFIITDLPGLGAAVKERAVNGKKIKNHDDITCDAIFETDAMVLLTDNTVKNISFQALDKMLEKLEQKSVVDKESRIIPILNKADLIKGEANIASAKETYTKVLKEHGLSIECENIRTYAAIFGEYKYKDIPHERLLNVQGNEYYRKGRFSAEDVYNDLAEDFKNISGIEELLLFFRSKYIEVGKYSKSLSAIHAMRNFANDAISQLVATAEKYDSLIGVQGEKAKSISVELQRVINLEISKGIKYITKCTELVEEKNSMAAKNMNVITDKYIVSFENALNKYKKDIKEIVSEFDRNWGGLSYRARIDRYGTNNYNLYHEKLYPALQTMDIDVREVNKAYVDILKSIKDCIAQIYEEAVNGLSELRDNVKNAVEKLAREGNDDNTAEAYKALGNTVIKLLDKKMEFAQENAERLTEDVINFGKNVAETMSKENDRMVDDFVSNVTGSVKNKIANGKLCSSREYIDLYGEYGVLSVINNTILTEDEKNNIRLNIEATGVRIILNKLGDWVEKAYRITAMYIDIQEKITSMFKETDENILDSAEKMKATRDESLEKAERWKSIFATFGKNIQKTYKDAVEYMDDTTISEEQKTNIMHGAL